MSYKVVYKRKIEKKIRKMPSEEQKKMAFLIDDLVELGPVQINWLNYSQLGQEKGYLKHHCHLSYRWVACWKHKKDTIEIEVYYAGSRESAPY